ncbi:hypothetical protein PsalN5692_03184 [Piscirickettsia salmonis]|uniref:hypothetical protein n=1 Tax=Piscirickettsia salmonis TaxID=1238 RepID=UPI0018AD00E6|nr:hypothetical protein PsalN5692_03184 [Piscirickettsia salmonis]
MDTSLIGLFCIVDDFCQVFLPHWKASLLEHQDKQRNKPIRMSTSEIMTLMRCEPRSARHGVSRPR